MPDGFESHRPSPSSAADNRSTAEGVRLRVEHALSDLMFFSTRIRFRAWKNWQMRWFTKKYQVNLDETPVQDPEAYPDFDTFFTRALVDGARTWPQTGNIVCSPADGVLSEIGKVTDGAMIHAKSANYDLGALLGGNDSLAADLNGGHFFTVYLSPRDYHRVHTPLPGRLVEMRYVPGRLFSVNPRTVAQVPNLFARNERTVCVFETAYGPMAVVMVAAVFVGGIEHPWCGVVTPPRSQHVVTTTYGTEPLRAPTLDIGDELGRFHMGSTVVTIIPGATSLKLQSRPAGLPIEVGTNIASYE